MSMAAIAVVATPLVVGGINAAIQKNKANKMEGDILAQQGVVEQCPVQQPWFHSYSGAEAEVQQSTVDSTEILVNRS